MADRGNNQKICKCDDDDVNEVDNEDDDVDFSLMFHAIDDQSQEELLDNIDDGGIFWKN